MTTMNPEAASVLRCINFRSDGTNCRNRTPLMNLTGIRYLKSMNVSKVRIKTKAAMNILNLRRKGEVIASYILIRLIFSESSFILPRPILYAIVR